MHRKLSVPKSSLYEGPARIGKLNGRPLPSKEPLSVFVIVFLGTIVRMRMGFGSFRVKVALFCFPLGSLSLSTPPSRSPCASRFRRSWRWVIRKGFARGSCMYVLLFGRRYVSVFLLFVLSVFFPFAPPCWVLFCWMFLPHAFFFLAVSLLGVCCRGFSSFCLLCLFF